MRIGVVKLKTQLYCAEERAMGPGRATLLEAIDASGSISAASRTTGISYRKTWLMVDAMNRCFRDPLVETGVGGGRDRGARLTPAGRAALAAYRALEARIDAVADAHAGDLAAMIRETPLPPA